MKLQDIEKQIIVVYCLITISSNRKVRDYMIQRLVELMDIKRKALTGTVNA